MDNMTFSCPKRSKEPIAVLSGRSIRAKADGAGWSRYIGIHGASRRPGFLCACVLALLSLNLGGCGRAPESATIEAESRQGNDNLATVSNSIPVLRDGFEGKALEDFWLPGNYGSGLYVPGAIKLSTNYVRSGMQSVEITIREGDIDAAGDGDTRVERDELDSGHFALRGRDAWYGFSLLVPKDFPIIDDRLVISSCKQSDVSRPIVAQRFRNGKHTVTVESQGRKESYDLPLIPLGQWIDMIYHLRYSTGADGLVEIWMNGKQVVRYSGPAADPDAKNAFYNKIGLYRDRVNVPMTIYYDNYAMGGSKEDSRSRTDTSTLTLIAEAYCDWKRATKPRSPQLGALALPRARRQRRWSNMSD